MRGSIDLSVAMHRASRRAVAVARGGAHCRCTQVHMSAALLHHVRLELGEQVTEASTVVLVGKSAPAVKLDDKYYKLVDKLEALTEAPPSLVDAKSVTVKGPVLFKKGVVFKGDILVVNGTTHWSLQWHNLREGLLLS